MNTKLMLVLAAYLHVIGVATYLGGSLVMEVVLGPAQKAIPPAQAQVMGEKTADRFLIVAWSALALIGGSGVLRLFTVNNESILTSGRLFDSGYGRTLFTMIVLWGVLVVNGLIMTFVLRPRLKSRMGAQVGAAQVQARQQGMLRTVRWVTWISRADLVIVFVVALLGSSLKFGGIGGIV